MATPYVAGVAALYIAKYGGRAVHVTGFARKLQAPILASGERMMWEGADVDASPTQVGNGMIIATKIMQSNTQLSFTKFALNDTHHFSRYQAVDITDESDRAVESPLTDR
jgi:hypothetical protein